ncbi:hypothetical protein D9758_007470 [Tetrapyrgos nigripes]|uniref:Uncharacterized protein n=1 Tax=Tetrapyrgos nigripes TaxID=182062 RepID=A0A8H5G3F2_9AGAR|nr:hypothetical protein D9758_007470 [Tetrapyrgos nigripes]
MRTNYAGLFKDFYYFGNKKKNTRPLKINILLFQPTTFTLSFCPLSPPLPLPPLPSTMPADYDFLLPHTRLCCNAIIFDFDTLINDVLAVEAALTEAALVAGKDPENVIATSRTSSSLEALTKITRKAASKTEIRNFEDSILYYAESGQFWNREVIPVMKYGRGSTPGSQTSSRSSTKELPLEANNFRLAAFDDKVQVGEKTIRVDRSICGVPNTLAIAKTLRKGELAIVTSYTASYVRQCLRRLKFPFTPIILQRPKPGLLSTVNAQRYNPYRLVVEKLQFKPEECIVVTKSADNIPIARDSGAEVVAVCSRYSRAELEKCDPSYVVGNYEDLQCWRGKKAGKGEEKLHLDCLNTRPDDLFVGSFC